MRNGCRACVAFCESLIFIIRGSLCCCLSVGADGALKKPPLLSWVFKLFETPGLQSLLSASEAPVGLDAAVGLRESRNPDVLLGSRGTVWIYCFVGRLHLNKEVYFCMWAHVVCPSAMSNKQKQQHHSPLVKETPPLAVVGGSRAHGQWLFPACLQDAVSGLQPPDPCGLGDSRARARSHSWQLAMVFLLLWLRMGTWVLSVLDGTEDLN